MSVHERLRIGEAPVLAVHTGSAAAAGAQGTVLLYHGLGASKDGNLKELESLAARGFLAVGVDNVGHGERRWPDFEARFFGERARIDGVFHNAVIDTVREIPSLIDELLRRGWSRVDRLAVTGISMGGYIAYGAVVHERRFRAACPILGSPVWHDCAFSPHLTPERFYPTALLSQNAGRDQSVNPVFARELRTTLGPHYAAGPERLAHMEFERSAHFMEPDDWDRLWQNVLAWLERFTR